LSTKGKQNENTVNVNLLTFSDQICCHSTLYLHFAYWGYSIFINDINFTFFINFCN